MTGVRGPVLTNAVRLDRVPRPSCPIPHPPSLEKSTGVPTRTHTPFDIVKGLIDTESRSVDAGSGRPANGVQHRPCVPSMARRYQINVNAEGPRPRRI